MHNEYSVLIMLIGSLMVYSLLAQKINKYAVTGPMFMAFMGLIYAFSTIESQNTSIALDAYQMMIELTLAFILFNDAAKTKLSVLEHSYAYPVRLLLIGLPLTFIFGVLLGSSIFEHISIIELGLLAIILTPTDAALSADFLNNKRLSKRVREAVNVESGLNDGLAVPVFVLLLYAYSKQQAITLDSSIVMLTQEIGLALLVSLTLSPLLFKLVLFSEAHKLFSKEVEVFIFIPIALSIYLITQAIGGSGFFATFIAGLLFDFKFKSRFKPQRLSDSHAIAVSSSLIVWFIFGLFSYPFLTNGVSLKALLYAICALTIMRIVPVIIATSFTSLSFKSRLTLAWFGPRGLASVVFTLILINSNTHVPELIIETAVLTIILSVIAHGVSSRLIK